MYPAVSGRQFRRVIWFDGHPRTGGGGELIARDSPSSFYFGAWFGPKKRREIKPLIYKPVSANSSRRPRMFTTENIGLATQHGYFSVAAERSEVFTPPLFPVDTH
jgi:hypothetical protein